MRRAAARDEHQLGTDALCIAGDGGSDLANTHRPVGAIERFGIRIGIGGHHRRPVRESQIQRMCEQGATDAAMPTPSAETSANSSARSVMFPLASTVEALM